MTTKTSQNGTQGKILTFELTGTAPLLMHNGQLADPLNSFTKALKDVTKKRKKSDDDLTEISRLEWRGSLYYDAQLGPVIPSEIIDSVLVEGAKKSKQGKAFKSAVFCVEGPYKLEYEGPRDEAGLWKDPSFRSVLGVRVGQSRVMRCRPRFAKWKLTIKVLLLPGDVNVSDVTDAIENAGIFVGLCDFRPRFGRFTVTAK